MFSYFIKILLQLSYYVGFGIDVNDFFFRFSTIGYKKCGVKYKAIWRNCVPKTFR